MFFDHFKFVLPAFLVDLEEFSQIFLADFAFETIDVDGVNGGQSTDSGILEFTGVVAAVKDPGEDTAVVAEAGPHELAFGALAEPVHAEDFGQVAFGFTGFADFEPMFEVVAHVVAAEGQHGEGVTTDSTGLHVEGGSGHFGTDGGTDEHTMFPALGLIDQGEGGGTASAEEERGDRHTGRIFPFSSDGGAVAGLGGETGVGVSSLDGLAVGIDSIGSPIIALPVDEVSGGIITDAFPPHVTVIGESDVGEDGILGTGEHGVLVGLHAGTGSNTEETGFGVDGTEVAFVVKLHPCNIVTDGLDFPAGEGGDEHGEVGFSASGGESTGNILDFALGVGQLEDEHVFGEPAFIAGLNGGNTESEALLAEEGVAAVTGTERPDFTGFGEVSDVFLFDGGAGPDTVIAFTFGEGFADGVDAGDEFAVAEDVEDFGTDAGHHGHVDNNVGGVGDFNADLGDGRTDGAHGEGDDVHGTALHAAVIETEHGLFEFFGVDPVVGGTGGFLSFGSDEGTGFNAGNVGRIGAEQQAVRTLFGVEADCETAFDHLVAETIIFFFGTVTPVDRIRLADSGPLVDPCDQLLIIGRGSIELLHLLYPPI